MPATFSIMREKRIGRRCSAITLIVQRDHLSEIHETISRVSESSSSVRVSQNSLISSQLKGGFWLLFLNSYLIVSTGTKGALLQKYTVDPILNQ
jgi:hypothetical protein